MKTTISVIKADVGGWPGHSKVHHKLCEVASELLGAAKSRNIIKDFYVTHCGDDLELIMTHTRGENNSEVHEVAWNAFTKATECAKELKLYGAGQDMLKDAFSGNVRGMGPGVAEMEFSERKAEPVIVFMMDKTEPGAFNFPIFKTFADPFNTSGLVIDPNLHAGFVFEIWDILEHKKIIMNTPEELYSILALIGAKSRFVTKRVFPKPGGKLPANEPVAVISTEKLYQIAGEYVGKDDPVAILRAQSGLPALGEILEPYSIPFIVSGWMRGSHNGPIMPVPIEYAQCTRFDGPPRTVALGFQINNAQLGLPVDLFNDPAYDSVRMRCIDIANYIRLHGPFEPHRLPLEDMEYTTLPKIMTQLKNRFTPID